MRNTYANINISREIQNIQISIRCKIQDIQISRRQSIWCKIYMICQNISGTIYLVHNTYMQYQDILDTTDQVWITKYPYLSPQRQSIWCKIHEISSYFWDLSGAKYPNISQIIFRVQNTHEISRYPGDHLSGAGNWRSQEANGGPLPQASRAKPSFTGFPDSSQTYLLAFVMPLIFDNRYFLLLWLS